MPLYNINDVKVEYDNYSTLIENNETHIRRLITRIIRHKNEYFLINGINPKFFISNKTYNTLFESSLIFMNLNYVPSGNYIGNISGLDVYLSKALINEEYYIGLDEKEIQIYRRKDKLSKIKDKLNATI